MKFESCEKVVYVIGVFDLSPRGHLELLKRAKMLSDKLVVVINGVGLVENYKRRSFFTENNRL